MKETVNLFREAVRLEPKKEGVSRDSYPPGLTEKIMKSTALTHAGHRHIFPGL